VLNEPGPPLSGVDRAALVAAVESELAGHAVLVLTGSLPPGPDQGLYATLVERAHARGLRVVVDAAREALAAALVAGPDVVTPNLGEARALLGGAVEEAVEPDGDVRSEALGAAAALREAGARAALVTAGRYGVAGAHAGGSFWIAAPVVEAVNPIGAGDCFAAGLAAGLEAGEDLPTATLRAVATGSASVTTSLPGHVDAVVCARLLAALSRQAVALPPDP
jgi:fructose-1-phosphate kinase PfkB-like protein